MVGVCNQTLHQDDDDVCEYNYCSLLQLMRRVCEVRWPGGVGPGGKTLNKIGQQVLELASQYTNKVTHAYSTRGGYTDRISSEVRSFSSCPCPVSSCLS